MYEWEQVTSLPPQQEAEIREYAIRFFSLLDAVDSRGLIVDDSTLMEFTFMSVRQGWDMARAREEAIRRFPPGGEPYGRQPQQSE